MSETGRRDGDGDTSSHAAMQLVAEANNAFSSGVASAGDWPPKVEWWGTQAFQGNNDNDTNNSGKSAEQPVEQLKDTEGAPEGRGRRSRRETGLQRSGRQSLLQNSASDEGGSPLLKSGKIVRKPRAADIAKDRLDAGIDALLTRGPPKLPEGADSIYDKLRDQRQHLRLMESTGRGAVMSSVQKQPLRAVLNTPPESNLSRSASRGSMGSATVEDRLVQEAFAYAARLGATGGGINSKATATHDMSGLGNKALSRRGSGRRGGRSKSSSGKGGGVTVARRKNGVGSRKGNQKTSTTKSFDHSPLAQRRTEPRRGKAEFQLRDLRPEPVQNLDTLLEHLQSGNPARKLRMQLSKSKQSLDESEAFIQLAKESWFG